MDVCGRQVLPLDVAICCSIGCLHLMEDSLFSHCQCSASSKALKGSRSNDIVHVFPCSLSLHLSCIVYGTENCRRKHKKQIICGGVLGDQNRMLMYILFQAAFIVATMALTVPIFMSYELHVIFQILKVSASIWNGGSFLLEVMPRQVIMKEKKKLEMLPLPVQPDSHRN
ncbi:hypothetical protein MKW98_028342 [Papaver atlanticum]|uniref:Glycerophosphocholine acyltransferase 1 n=1 Tax=Papaver atlanticum TaxID=357466 RepID=A0AAD4SW79_9MAGN|nr:hypothetical protein MKW98_028342 [Papaver atlanticum]